MMIKANWLSKKPRNRATFATFFSAVSIPMTTTALPDNNPVVRVYCKMHEVLTAELSVVQNLFYAEGMVAVT